MKSYTVHNRYLGRRYDGLVSPLATPTELGSSLSMALTHGRDIDEVTLPDSKLTVTLAALKWVFTALGYNVDALRTASDSDQDRALKRAKRYLEDQASKIGALDAGANRVSMASADEASMAQRTALHRSLVSWATGPLRMERPQGSSYHHLVEYEKLSHSGRSELADERNLQHIVVENDWAKALAGKGADAGEVRMPFEEICWEFRVSGVRIMAFTVVEDSVTTLLLVYGRDNAWVSDDYAYVMLESGRLDGHPHHLAPLKNPLEFRRVADLIHSQIRAACILLDVKCVRREVVPASPRLVQKRVSERRAPPVDHIVVRLAPRQEHRRAARSRGASVGGVQRAPQRGHLRRGCWVHYDDQDAGEVQYANDGGFLVSKTWREWHWAGDLNNMIEREYRL